MFNFLCEIIFNSFMFYIVFTFSQKIVILSYYLSEKLIPYFEFFLRGDTNLS